MRVIRTLAVVLPIFGLAAGCTSHHSEYEFSRALATPALLFDDQPGYPSASEVAYRSDWPSAESYYQFGEVIYYQERFIDIQGSEPYGRNHHGHTYRRFSSHRAGFGSR